MLDQTVGRDSLNDSHSISGQCEDLGESCRAVRRELAVGYSRHRAITIHQLRDADATDEVMQDFALKALERADHLREPLAVRGWLRRLLQTTLVDFCRRRSISRQREVAFELNLHDYSGTGSNEDLSDPALTVGVALADIRSEYADVIYRLDILGQSNSAAANALGITVNNLMVRAHRSRKALRETISAMPMRRRKNRAEANEVRQISRFLNSPSPQCIVLN